MRRILPLLILPLLGFAPAPFPKVGQDPDLQKLQGKWEDVSIIVIGMPLRISSGHDTAVFKGNELLLLTDGIVKRRWTATIDSTQKPKWLDLVDEDKKTRQTIYELDKNTLKICFVVNLKKAKKRPDTFDGSNGSDQMLLILKRKKP